MRAESESKGGGPGPITPGSKIGSAELMLFALILFYIISQTSVLSEFEGLPSPLYGGDMYHQLGSIYHISQSGPAGWFGSSTFRGGLPIYLPVYGVYVSLFVWLFGLTPLKAMLFSSVFAGVLIPLTIYVILKRLFDDGFVAVAGVMMFFPLSKFPILKYTVFAHYLMTPVFAYALYAFFFREANRRNAVVLGLAFGLYSLTHVVGFIISGFFTAFFSLLYLLFRTKAFGFQAPRIIIRKNRLSGFARRGLPLIAIVFSIGVIISLTYWFKPIFVYRGVTLNDIQEWTFGDFGNREYRWHFLRESLSKFFQSLDSTLYPPVGTLLGLMGFVFLLELYNKSDLLDFVRWFLAASLLLSFSYFLTEPLFGTNLNPDRIAPFTFGLSALFLVLISLTQNPLPIKLRRLLVVAVILVAAVGNIRFYYESFSKGDFGYSPKGFTPEVKRLQGYVLSTTDLNDVFLSTNEISFILNSVTGRKTLITRRAHSDVFTEYDQRELDAAIILYGNNTRRKLELLRRYDVRYLLWTNTWVLSEYPSVELGSDLPWFDPIVIVENEGWVKVLEENGVDYFRRNTWLDPAIKDEYVKKMDLVFVSPKNYRSKRMPWRGDLDPYLTQVWNDSKEGVEVAALYEFNRSMIKNALA